MPKTPQDNMIDIPVVLSKKVDGVIYNLIVRSSTDQVFQDNYSLTEILKDVSKSIDARVTKEEYAEVQQHLNTFFADQPEELQTLRDVHNYIQSANNKIEEANKILRNKIDTSVYEGDKKQIMTQINNIKQDVSDMITNGDLVSKENFEERIKQLEIDIRADMYKNILGGEGDNPPEDLIDGGFWIQYLE